MDTPTVTLELTQEEYDVIRQCEAVVVRTYRSNGSDIAKPVAWGDESEMRDAAATQGIFVVPVGCEIVGQECVPVRELLGH